jgi:hypothetical protein
MGNPPQTWAACASATAAARAQGQNRRGACRVFSIGRLPSSGLTLTLLDESNPWLPDEISDRQQDAWEILFAIADLAGGEWPDRARYAARTLAASRVDGTTNWGHRLLEDLRRLFEQGQGGHLTSHACLEALTALEDSPWVTWNKGKGLSSWGLNKLLEPYEIRTHDVRVDGRNLKGVPSTGA